MSSRPEEKKAAKKEKRIEKKAVRAEKKRAKREAKKAQKQARRQEHRQAAGQRMKKGSPEQQKRMSSITRRLHWTWLKKKLGHLLRIDLLMMLLFVLLWCLDREYSRTHSLFFWKNSHYFTFADESVRTLVYRVVSPEGKVLVNAAVYQRLVILLLVFVAVLSLQLLGLLFAYIPEDRQIRRILAPLNEMALKADALSRMAFTEDKFARIEETIEQIEPGEETTLSFGDADLAGIEAAMNNLLLRMRESYRQQARFVNDASHELRTPIAVIQGYANMLDRWGKSDEKILEESIAAIKHESDHMNHLVEQLLFLARGDAGKTQLQPEPVSLPDLMQEVYEESLMIDETHVYRYKNFVARETAGDDGEAETNLQREEKEAGLIVEADYSLLKQAVRILTDNASKYNGAGEEIIFSVGRSLQGEPYLQVQDSGTGIALPELPHIFERFYRSDEVRASAGTGLGLSIAKWIVDKHGGRFEVLSRTGLGTRIQIILPAALSRNSDKSL